MKNKEIVIYDNNYDCEKFDRAKQYLFDEYAYDRDWNTIDDVPDKTVFEEIDLPIT